VSGAFARGREGAATVGLEGSATTTGAEDYVGNCYGGAALLGFSWLWCGQKRKNRLQGCAGCLWGEFHPKQNMI
jgi:hypothetical protein